MRKGKRKLRQRLRQGGIMRKQRKAEKRRVKKRGEENGTEKREGKKRKIGNRHIC